MFEELILHKTPVKIYLCGQESPLCGKIIRYNDRRNIIILHPHIVIPEKYILKVESFEYEPQPCPTQ